MPYEDTWFPNVRQRFFYFLTRAGHSLYLPDQATCIFEGVLLTSYGRHIYVRPRPGLECTTPVLDDRRSVTTELWGQISYFLQTCAFSVERAVCLLFSGFFDICCCMFSFM